MTNSWTMLYDEILKMDENTNTNLNLTDGDWTKDGLGSRNR